MGKTKDFQTVKVAAGNERKPEIWVFRFSVFRGEIGGEENWFLGLSLKNEFWGGWVFKNPKTPQKLVNEQPHSYWPVDFWTWLIDRLFVASPLCRFKYSGSTSMQIFVLLLKSPLCPHWLCAVNKWNWHLTCIILFSLW